MPAHFLNLVKEKAAVTVTEIVDYFSILQQLHFFPYSSHRGF